MQTRELKVVLDEDPQKLLESLGLLPGIEAGEVLCSQCGTPISVSIVAFIVAQTSDYLLVCSDEVDPIGWTKKRPFLDGVAG